MPMNPDFDNLLKKIFQANRLEEADVLSMEQLAGQHPYFAPLQYLLAKKYSQLGYAQYGPQIAKTAIFFSNPHWLNDLLSSDQEANNLKEDLENTGEFVEEQTLHVLPSQPIAKELISEEEVPGEKNNELSEAFPEQNKDAEPSGEEQEQPVVDENSISHDFESPLPVAETSEAQFLTVQAPVGPEEATLSQPVPEEAPPDALLQDGDIVSTDDDAMLPEAFYTA